MHALFGYDRDRMALSEGVLALFGAYASEGRAPPPRARPLERLIYGFAQPVVGVRRLFRDRTLLRQALTPVGFLAGFCAFTAIFQPWDEGVAGYLKSFYAAFTVLAPLPSLLFGAHYARLAARAHHGFGRPCEPKVERLPRAMKRALFQWMLVGSASVPLAIVAGLDDVGAPLAAAIAAVWGLHWIVVEAFDNAQVLAPGETIADADRAALAAPPPWFVRGLVRASEKTPRFVASAFRAWAWFNDRFSRGWREEVRLIEEEKVLAVGFAAATAVLLATPVLNLFFRPVVIVAASHLLVQLRAEALVREPDEGTRGEPDPPSQGRPSAA